MTRRPKLLYLVSEDWYFVSHRLPLALAAKAAGFDVAVATRVGRHGAAIEDAGLRLIPISMARSSLAPVHELRTLREVTGLVAREAPDLVHNVALKPVIYGTHAARRAGIKGVVNALMGLGWVFSSDSAKARALRPFIAQALRYALSAPDTRTIVQNGDDAALLGDRALAPRDTIRLIRGSGVDPGNYRTDDAAAGTPLVVLPARLLIAKGVREFISAAALLKSQGVNARFALVGEPDTDNPAAIAREEILDAVLAGHVEHWGWRNDMPDVFAEASLVCLPTFYGEGVPKALIEAAASARAIVATDVPGCREIVRPGDNGWLVPPRDVEALATALRQAIAQPGLCAEFGTRGRRKAEREFSLEAVIHATLGVYAELVAMPAARTAYDGATNVVPLRRAS
jgi:glycosyltransferase involved in cell wall biosynthesis